MEREKKKMQITKILLKLEKFLKLENLDLLTQIAWLLNRVIFSFCLDKFNIFFKTPYHKV